MPECWTDRAIMSSAIAIVAWAVIGLPLFEELPSHSAGDWLTKDAAGFFTFLLVIVAISQLGLFLRQLRYIRESLDDAKVAAVAAMDASEAAKTQADTAREALRTARDHQRETTAKATYREFLTLAIEHADLAEGDYQAIKRNGRQAKYDWFVAYFLWAAEEILDYDEKEWQKNLEAVAAKHCEYFQTPEFQNKELPLYTDKAKALVGSVLGKSDFI
jgi:hypothetical protein